MLFRSESTPYKIQTSIKAQDSFWIKSQPYSLSDMLDHDMDYIPLFIGGTIYQAFLSALFYHRWHSPITGTVRRTTYVNGTYYSEAESQGYDPAGPNNSQAYITHTAARAIIYIECDRVEIGMIAIVFVGMAEVSSNVFLSHLVPGYHVTKGEELGYFQYGGSTHCVIFRPGVISHFAANAIPQADGHHHTTPAVLLNTCVAIAR